MTVLISSGPIRSMILRHHDRKVRNRPRIDQHRLFAIDEQVGVALEIGFLVVEADPVDFARDRDGPFEVDR